MATKPNFIFTFQNSCDNVAVSTFTPSDNGGKQAFTVTGYDLADYMDQGDEITFTYSTIEYTYTIIDITGNQVTISLDYDAGITNANTTLDFLIKTDAKPKNFDKGKFQWEKDRENYFMRIKYSGKVLFNGLDYTYLDEALNTGCCNVPFKIYKLCDGEYSLFYRAVINKFEGTWNESRCTFESEIIPFDKYRCILAIMDNEINIYPDLNGIARESLIYAEDDAAAGWTYGPFYDFYISPTIPTFVGDTGYTSGPGANFTQIVAAGYAADPNTGNPWTTTVREVKYITYIGDPITFVTPSVAGWTFTSEIRSDGKIIAKYSKLATSGAVERTGQTWGTGGDCDPVQSRVIVYDPINDNCIHIKIYTGTDFENYRFVTMADSLDMMVSFCKNIQEVTSDFFEINPIGDTPGYVAGDNYVTAKYNFVNYLLLSALSDVVYPTGDPALILNYTLKKLLNTLRNMFNVYWFIDTENRFRLEHESWFIANIIIDVSNEVYNSGFKSYTYIKEDVPNREKFNFRIAQNTDFVGTDIVYSGICTDFPQTLLREVDVITDINHIRNTSSDFFPNDGIVMWSTSPLANSGVVLYDTGMITGISMQNNHLSWANLQYNYHMYGRIIETGLMNYISTNFTTWKKRKKQMGQKYLACCLTIPETLGQVTTELGTGDAIKITYDINSNTYEFELNQP